MLKKISIQDLQFNGNEQTQKLVRLMDDLRRVVAGLNTVIEEVNTLLSTDTTTVSPHVLATTTGLGAEHTVSGLGVGQVLVADSATDALFRKLRFSDLDQTAFSVPTNGDVIKFVDGYYVLGPVSASFSLGHGLVEVGDTISVNESVLDHGSLSGLGDNDHPQYALRTQYYKQFLLMGA